MKMLSYIMFVLFVVYCVYTRDDAIFCVYPLFDRTLLKKTMIDDGRD